MLNPSGDNRPIFILAAKAVEHDEAISLQDVTDAINAGELEGSRSDDGWMVDINDFKRWKNSKVAGLEEKSQTENHDAKQNDISELLNLSDKELAVYNGEVSRNKLDLGTAYLLWALTGWAGGHKLYQNKLWGFIYPVLSVWGLSKFFMGVLKSFTLAFEPASVTPGSEVEIGAWMFGGWLVLMLIDLISLPNQIKRYNQNIQEQILKQLSNIRCFRTTNEGVRSPRQPHVPLEIFQKG